MTDDSDRARSLEANGFNRFAVFVHDVKGYWLLLYFAELIQLFSTLWSLSTFGAQRFKLPLKEVIK